MMFEEEVKVLIELLSQSDSKGVQLDALKATLRDRLISDSSGNPQTDASKIIQYALDNWIVDKVIDDPEPIGPPVWFIKILDDEGVKFYCGLPEVEKAAIKILRTSEYDGELGTIREDVLLRHLHELGFDVERIPFVSEVMSISFTSDNEKMVRIWHITPQFELSDEFKKFMEEAERAHEEKLSRRFGWL